MSAEEVNTLLDFDPADTDDGIKRDQWGRYVIPHPETGELLSWTRATTLKDVLEDKKNLQTWEMRNVVAGIGRREDLFALAGSVGSTTEAEDKAVLDEVITRAKEAGGGNKSSTIGTALHGFTQRFDLGHKDVVVPSQWKADVDAYLATLKEYGIWPHERLVERVVVIPEIETAGTFDRVFMGDGWELPRIGDLKTGSVTKRGRGFAMQQAMYAHATHIYDPKTKTFTPMPKVDQKVAVIVHLPAGEGKCDLYEIDIEAGWQDVLAAYAEHKRRKKTDYAKPLAKFEEPAPAKTVEEKPKKKRTTKPKATTVKCEICKAPFPKEFLDTHKESEHPPISEGEMLALRVGYARERVRYVIENGGGADLGDIWANACGDIPTFKAGGPRNNDEIDRVLGACSIVEATHEMPFPDFTDPSKTTNKTTTEKAKSA